MSDAKVRTLILAAEIGEMDDDEFDALQEKLTGEIGTDALNIVVRAIPRTEDEDVWPYVEGIVRDERLRAKETPEVIPYDLRLSFTPTAILEHFEGEKAGEKLAAFAKENPDKFRAACADAVMDDAVYDGFHRACVGIYEDVTGEEYG